ncbi:MAG: hypothetical protein KDA44_03560 [Planctomycetales bacterium]|nr:hypothetical protein [Planctomycetales bacterium]
MALQSAAARWLVAWLPLGWNRWLLVWLALASITVALLVLLRTRWRSVSSWKKCALLSLWLHVLLAALATSVHLFSGAPGSGPDKTIRVAMLPAELPAEVQPQSTDEQKLPEWERPVDPPRMEPPELLLPEPPLESPVEAKEEPAPDVAYDETSPADPAPEPKTQETPAEPKPLPEPSAPPLIPEPADEAPREQVVAEQPADAAPPEEQSQTPNQDRVADAAPVTEQALPPQSQPPRPVPPPKYAARFSERRAEIVARRGGNAQTEQSVRSALAWLAAAQSPDGGWRAAQFGAGQERAAVLGQDRAGVGAKADTAMTGLALLAFLGSGNTHLQGPYAEHVARGLEFLAVRQAADGSLAGDADRFSRMYCHSMAALAVCESYAVTADPRLRQIAAGALTYSIAAQHPSDGGWRYWPGLPGDTSQLGWQLMALGSGELAGLDVPPVTWTRAERFLRSVTRGSAGGLACYRPDSRPTTSMTAEGLFCRQLLADRLGATVDDPAYGEAASTVLRELPGGGQVNLYYWYYATLALCREQDRSPAARAAWQRWNDALVRTLLDKQRPDGSWPVDTVWGRCGGQVYTTSLAALCLEVYYRYAPEEPETEIAGRRRWYAAPRR